MDHVIESVGEFGKFQYKVITIVGLISTLSSVCIFATIFIYAEPDLICKNISNHTDNFKNYDFIKNTSNTTFETNECKIWSNLKEDKNLSKDYKCYFNKTYYDKTIITEWNLICNKQYLASLTQTFQMIGSIFGFCSGIVGDKYGRRPAVFLLL